MSFGACIRKSFREREPFFEEKLLVGERERDIVLPGSL